LNAAWRYYNLADFAISRQNPKASVALRVAFEDAQTFLGGKPTDGPAVPVGAPDGNPKSVGLDEAKAVTALAMMERTLEEVIREGAQAARAGGAEGFLPRQ